MRLRASFAASIPLLALACGGEPERPPTSVCGPPLPSTSAFSAHASLASSAELDHLFVVKNAGLSAGEKLLLVSLQGVLAQRKPRVWIDANPASSALLADLVARHGVTTEPGGKPLELAARFRDELHGYVRFDLGDDSQNVAASLAGVLGAVVADAEIAPKLDASGLACVFDARGANERWLLERHASLFARGLTAEIGESPLRASNLRDLTIARGAFVFSAAHDHALRADAARAFGPLVFGYHTDEIGEEDFIRELGDAGAVNVPSDLARNLSALAAVKEPTLEQLTHAPPPADEPDGVHWVAFVMTDGDNLGWIDSSFWKTWRDTHRGTFPMNWEMAPLLADVAPSLLRLLELQATTGVSRDFFVTGNSGLAYYFPDRLRDEARILGRTGDVLARSDLRFVTVVGDRGDMRACDGALALRESEGVLYKDYDPYDGHHGAIRWRGDKPCVAYRHRLWQPDDPENVAAALASAPRHPRTDEGSYSLVNVLAWMPQAAGGPLGAVARTIENLPPEVRVVTVEELFQRLRANLGRAPH